MRLFDRYRPVFNAEGGAGGAGGEGQPPAATPPAATPPAGGPGWISPDLPQETRDYLAKAEYGKADKPDAALIHLQQLASAQAKTGPMLAAPKDENDTEALDGIYKALGRPESADKYDLKFPEGYQANEKLTTFAKDMAFKLGADGKKAQALVDGYLAIEKEMLAGVTGGINEHNATAMAALEKEFGAGLNEAKANGTRALEALGLPQETLAFFDANKGSAHIARVLAAIGKGMGEGSGFNPSPGGGLTPEKAKQALADFQNSTEYQQVFAQGTRHPKYKDVVAQLDVLAQAAYPTRRA